MKLEDMRMIAERTPGTDYISLQFDCGRICLFDADDEDLVREFKWRAVCNNKTTSANWYVRGYGPKDPESGKRRDIFMHRFLLDAPKHLLVDHINGNGLDNRRSNLRLANFSQNTVNRHQLRKDKSSKYLGVSLSKNGKYFQSITSNKDEGTFYLGSSADEHLCALKYDKYALNRYGDFYNGNFPRSVVDYILSLENVAEAAKQMDVGHHSLCNAPFGGSCSCGLTLLKGTLAKLERE